MDITGVIGTTAIDEFSAVKRNRLTDALSVPVYKPIQRYVNFLLMHLSLETQEEADRIRAKAMPQNRKIIELRAYINSELTKLQKNPDGDVEKFFKGIFSNSLVRSVFLNEAAKIILSGREIGIAAVDSIIDKTLEKAMRTKKTFPVVYSYLKKQGIVLTSARMQTPDEIRIEALKGEHPGIYASYSKWVRPGIQVMTFDLYVELQDILGKISARIINDKSMARIMKLKNSGRDITVVEPHRIFSIVSGIINSEIDKLEPDIKKYFKELFKSAYLNQAICEEISHRVFKSPVPASLDGIGEKINLAVDSQLRNLGSDVFKEQRAELQRAAAGIEEPPGEDKPASSRRRAARTRVEKTTPPRAATRTRIESGGGNCFRPDIGDKMPDVPEVPKVRRLPKR